MRTLNECLDELRRGGEITEEEFARLRDAFEARRAQLRMALGDEEAATRAAEELAADLKAAAIEKRRRAALTVVAHRRLKEELQSFRRGDGAPDINEAALRAVQRIEHRKHAIEGMARAMFAGFLDETRRTKLSGNIRNRVLVDDVIRAWHGDANVSAEARGFAAALDQTFEWLRQRLNDAGAAMPKLEDYGGPHWHDPRALRRAGFEQWREFILPRLDPDSTGEAMAGRPFSWAELSAVLPRIYETIVTEGWNEREPLMRPSGLGSLAARRAEPRLLHFRSGEAWLEYNRAFGAGDPFQAIMLEVSRRARDIAAMELFGPNPDGMIHWLRQVVEREGANAAAGRPSLARRTGELAASAARWTSYRLDAIWATIKGEGTTPVAVTGAELMGTLRSWQVASKLGRAVISSLGDLGTQRLARTYAGLGGSVMADMMRYLTHYRLSRDEAARAGLLIESTLTIFREQAIFAKGWAVRGLADWLAERVLAWSGLTPWTHAGRHVFGFSFFAEVADARHRAWDGLPDHLRETFARHGLDRTDWDVIRAANIHVPSAGLAAGFIRPADVLALADGPALPRVQQILRLTDLDAAEAERQARRGIQDVATRYLEMVMAETEYAVPTATARARTLAIGRTRPGTIEGEALRSMTQFRAYPFVFGLLWGQRIADDLFHGGSWERRLRGGRYAVALFVTTTLLGALAVQLKNIAAGRDPEHMDPSTAEGRKFWTSAMAQGGGLGIFSDFLFADYSRYGSSLGATIGGPLLSSVETISKMTLGQMQRAAEGKATSFGREFVRFVDQNLPGGNLWYLDLAKERLLIDSLRRLADPDADKAFRRQIRAHQRERHQEFWFAPGELAPRRPPDLGAAVR